MISPLCARGHIGSYTLSVRDLDQEEGDVIKHYRIRNMDDGGFYITAKISFSTIRELVKHHKRTGEGVPLRVGRANTRLGSLTLE